MRPDVDVIGDRLARRLSRRLGVPIDVAVEAHPLPCTELTAGELSVYGRLPSSGPRRRQWLTGRRALRAVLARQGGSVDTAGLSFPHPRYSLTHADRWAVAVAVAVAPGGGGGLGVDFEPSHPLDPRTARFFLTGDDLEWAQRLEGPHQSRELLRLWTVKEAVFKADQANHSTGLADYTLDDPAAAAGTASGSPISGFRCAYATVAGLPDLPGLPGLPGLVTCAHAS